MIKDWATAAPAATLDIASCVTTCRSTDKPLATAMLIVGMLEKREGQDAHKIRNATLL